jgi:hypothetical protein
VKYDCVAGCQHSIQANSSLKKNGHGTSDLARRSLAVLRTHESKAVPGMALSLGVLGLAFSLPLFKDVLGWVSIGSLMAYAGSIAVGLGPVFWLIFRRFIRCVFEAGP